MFKHLDRDKRAMLSFLKGFFQYIHEEEYLDEIMIQIEYIFQKKKLSTKEKRGDIIIYTPHYIINIEAQTTLNLESLKKELSYLSSTDAEQLKEKQKYTEGKKVIGIIIAGKVSKNLNLPNRWFQKYNFKGDGPEYKELPSNIELYILNVDKAKEMGYNDGENDLLLRHLQMIGEKSLKKMKQIAREDEDLMILAANAEDFRQARKAKRWTSEEKERVIAYGEGKDDRSFEIAKAMLEESDVSYISKVTGLSIENIEELKNS